MQKWGDRIFLNDNWDYSLQQDSNDNDVRKVKFAT